MDLDKAAQEVADQLPPLTDEQRSKLAMLPTPALQEIVDNAPPLNAEQIERIRALLPPVQ